MEVQKLIIEKMNEYRPIVTLTQKGKDLVLKLIPLWVTIMDELTSKIGDEGMEMILSLKKGWNK